MLILFLIVCSECLFKAFFLFLWPIKKSKRRRRASEIIMTSNRTITKYKRYQRTFGLSIDLSLLVKFQFPALARKRPKALSDEGAVSEAD